jgi:glycosyltransferase involved in cell wall biosynthesis
VAVVVSQLGYGGAERQTVALLKELRGTPWAPRRIICLSENVAPLGAAVAELGYPLTVIPRSKGFELRRCFLLRRQLVRDGIGVVHAVNWLAAAYSLLASPSDTHVITSIRNSRLPATTVRRLVLVRLLRRSAAILVNSECARQRLLVECGVACHRLALVRNGIDMARVGEHGSEGALRRELGIPAGAPIVAYVGRNARVKNIPRLLDVAARLLARRPDVHMVVAGEGLTHQIVANTCLQAEPRLHCLGARRDVPSLLHEASLLLLTSDSEGTPNVVLEALAASVPVVATRVGDLPDLLPEDCGILAGSDAEDLASAALEVLSNAHSYRIALDEQVKRITSAYSPSAMAAGTTAVWRQVAGSA